MDKATLVLTTNCINPSLRPKSWGPTGLAAALDHAVSRLLIVARCGSGAASFFSPRATCNWSFYAGFSENSMDYYVAFVHTSAVASSDAVNTRARAFL